MKKGAFFYFGTKNAL